MEPFEIKISLSPPDAKAWSFFDPSDGMARPVTAWPVTAHLVSPSGQRPQLHLGHGPPLSRGQVRAASPPPPPPCSAERPLRKQTPSNRARGSAMPVVWRKHAGSTRFTRPGRMGEENEGSSVLRTRDDCEGNNTLNIEEETKATIC
jgi:hypothetical protein